MEVTSEEAANVTFVPLAAGVDVVTGAVAIGGTVAFVLGFAFFLLSFFLSGSE